MPERAFWSCTPRKLKALTDVYIEHQGGKSEDKPKAPTGFIDQIF